MADRKAELDQKRAKVEAMRLERQRREAERSKRNEDVQSVAQLLDTSTNFLDADAILRELGIEANDNQSRSNGKCVMNNVTPHAIECAQEAIELNQDTPNGVALVNSALVSSDTSHRRRRPLTVSKVHSTSIAPSERLSYSKETQTNVEQILQTQRRVNIMQDDVSSVLTYDDGRPIEDDDVLEVCVTGRYHRATSAPRGYSRLESTTSTSTAHGHGHAHRGPVLQRLDSTTSAQSTALAFGVAQVQPGSTPKLSDEERARIVASEAFANFVMRASRVVERTIAQDDALVDYTIDKSAAIDALDRNEQLITVEREYYDEKWCRNRLVTALEWHQQFPELLLTAYSAPQDLAVQEYYGAPSASTTAYGTLPEGGVCLVWNARFKSNAPEFVFTCPSALTAACFVRNQPNLLVGGTYSGQLVIWDNRVLRRTPVHRTPLSTAAHTHPVYCVQMVGGSSQPSQLVSVSSDGRMCVWSVEMLGRPLERLELAFDKSAKTHVASGNVAVTALSCMAHDSNSFLVGAEDGGVYLGNRHGQTQNRTGLVSCFEAHSAHVSAVHCSPHALGSVASPSCDLSHLFLTAAFDSTVRIWSLRDDRPLCTLERSADYLNDAQFSPTHPALFSTVDSLGRVEVWNLLRDCESPIAVHSGAGGCTVKPELVTKLDGQGPTPPINTLAYADEHRLSGAAVRAHCKVRWNAAGNRMAVGDCSGRVQLLSLADRVAQPHADDATRFSRLLLEMKAAQTSNAASLGSHAHLHTQRVGSPLHRSISPLTMAING